MRQRRHGRRLQAGRDRDGVIQQRLRAVVVEHHVLLREHHALQPRGELVLGRRILGALALQQHRLGLADRVTERDQVVLAQRAPGADYVGDRFKALEDLASLERHHAAEGDVAIPDVLQDVHRVAVGPWTPSLRHAERREAQLPLTVLREEFSGERERQLLTIADDRWRSRDRVVPGGLVEHDHVINRDPIVEIAVGVKAKNLVFAKYLADKAVAIAAQLGGR